LTTTRNLNNYIFRNKGIYSSGNKTQRFVQETYSMGLQFLASEIKDQVVLWLAE